MDTPNTELKKRKLEENGGASVTAMTMATNTTANSTPPTIAIGPSEVPLTLPLSTESNIGIPAYLTRDTARPMLDLLSKEDLANIVLEAALRHTDVLDEVRRVADRDPSHRKIFVRGLGWETNSVSLKSTFSEFGDLEEAIAIIDKNTGKSRGYGFVTFKHMDGAINALREPSKRIDGRISVCQLASTGSASVQPPQDLAARKIYVGNVPLAWPVDHLLGIFSEYGEIEEGPLGLDKQAGKERGFALFIYKTAEATKRALEEPVKNIGGHQLFCKLAVEGAKQRLNPMHGQPDMSMPGLGMTQPGGSGPVPSNMPPYGSGGGSNQYGGPTPPQGMMTCE